MAINLPVNFGDPIYSVISTYEGSDGPILAEVLGGKTVNAIEVTPGKEPEEYKIQIKGPGDEHYLEIGSRMCHLSQEGARGWIYSHISNAVLLDRTRTVAAYYVSDLHSIGRVVNIPLSIVEFRGYVPGVLTTTEQDKDGYFMLYNRDARVDGEEPITCFLRDDNGQPVDAIFGAFLLFKMNENGEIIDIDEFELGLQRDI